MEVWLGYSLSEKKVGCEKKYIISGLDPSERIMI